MLLWSLIILGRGRRESARTEECVEMVQGPQRCAPVSIAPWNDTRPVLCDEEVRLHRSLQKHIIQQSSQCRARSRQKTRAPKAHNIILLRAQDGHKPSTRFVTCSSTRHCLTRLSFCSHAAPIRPLLPVSRFRSAEARGNGPGLQRKKGVSATHATPPGMMGWRTDGTVSI